MKIDRLLSIGLIFIVLFTSLGGSNYLFATNKAIEPSCLLTQGTQFSEDEYDVTHVFRETLKISVSSEAKSQCFNLIHDSSRFTFTIIGHSKYRSFLLAQLSQNPPKKLFLEFRSLLI